jgi:hypothetical protein
MKKEMKMSVYFEDEKSALEFKGLSEKMSKDKDFQEKLKNCNSEKTAYDLYKDKGYTDLSFEDFCKKFDELVDGQGESKQLNMEELGAVVGGSGAKRKFGTFLKYLGVAVPVVGGLISEAGEAMENPEKKRESLCTKKGQIHTVITVAAPLAGDVGSAIGTAADVVIDKYVNI